jgi:hypothetical protein
MRTLCGPPPITSFENINGDLLRRVRSLVDGGGGRVSVLNKLRFLQGTVRECPTGWGEYLLAAATCGRGA